MFIDIKNVKRKVKAFSLTKSEQLGHNIFKIFWLIEMDYYIVEHILVAASQWINFLA